MGFVSDSKRRVNGDIRVENCTIKKIPIAERKYKSVYVIAFMLLLCLPLNCAIVARV